eukprot:5081050-Alexandrium_andersonii.AAC.1
MVNELVGLLWAAKGERRSDDKPDDSFKMLQAMLAGPAETATTSDFVKAVVDEDRDDSSSDDSSGERSDGGKQEDA